MRLLLITNLYPPQELGGYGRCMADFAWGLLQRGHQIQVICNDAPYLGSSGCGPNGEPVDRSLKLKGNFANGVQLLQDNCARAQVDSANCKLIAQWLNADRWDGVLLGNLDLLGAEIFMPLLATKLPLLHHIGFVSSPYPVEQMPSSPQYKLLAASAAVRKSLIEAGLPVANAPVIYPGARVDLLGPPRVNRPLPAQADGTSERPLRVCFAGLMMASKGPHTLLEAALMLRSRGVFVEMMLAGGNFQGNYLSQMEQFCSSHGLQNQVKFLSQLNRDQLARFFRLNHVCVFPSIYPEAFGIVAAEAMASGLALVSTAVGGAAELFEDGISGLAYPPGDCTALANKLEKLAKNPTLLVNLQQAGAKRVKQQFSVNASAKKLEELFN